LVKRRVEERFEGTITADRVREIFKGLEHLIVKDDEAVVELLSLATAKNCMCFDNV
jgi:hypothetical protein